MIKVSVMSTDVRNQSGTSKAGKPYSMTFQTVWLHTVDQHGKPNPFPEKVEIILPKNAEGAALFYPVGDYTLAPESLYVDRGGDLKLSPRLVALKPRPQAAA
ncbi:single-stranded DNA-binding protein [Curvibacter sp. HBC28]|uniref:Single-stranded DNA-binding protein n=1 Tax=Curvibacter microcysteis TaxID=3026419 RepID=A0ABT5MKY7_9BURK|nr:single-stranded DNA-binding protein [Curvibacter sp. HBC28]MDD0817252.1 single-stranded DNA-binding protein [Curvibacter sp. HBC28]